MACAGRALLIVVAGSFVGGCNRGPAAVHVPSVDPPEASRQAFELYDTNKDGQLSKPELTACPGILGHVSAYDADQSGLVSPQEVEAQIEDLTSGMVGVTSLEFMCG